jgi:hypothetical protein
MAIRQARIICICIIASLAGGLSTIVYSSSNYNFPATSEDRPIDITNLRDNSRWTKVNEQPYRISSRVDRQCRLPTQKDYADARRENPHAAAYVNVYVNKSGTEAMRSQEQHQFPAGSVLVKEKFYSDGPATAEKMKVSLFTVMVKREPGYNPGAGDWEFAVVSEDGKQVQARGKLENCISCHVTQSDRDHVFGTYLKRSGR